MTDPVDTNISLIVQITLLLFISVSMFCCFCKFFERFVSYWTFERSQGNLSDIVYIRQIMGRRQIEEEKKLDSPEVRKSKLLDSFEKNKVCMVSQQNSKLILILT